MALTFKVNGQEYTRYLSISLQIRLDAMCNSFTVVASNTNSQRFPFSLGDQCEIFVDGIKKLTGQIESFDGSYSAKGYNLSVHGRDKTSTILDSKLYTIDALTGSTSLKNICQIVIKHLKADISVVVQEGLEIDDFNLAEDLFAPVVGRSAYDFLEALALKRNVLLSSNANGDLLLTKNSPSSSSGTLQNLISDPTRQNNIMEADFSYDNTNRFNLCICSSQLNLTAVSNAGVTDLASVVAQSGQAYDDEIAKGRQFVFEAEVASSDGQNLPRAEWEVNMRKARGTRLNLKVEGHSVSQDVNELWDVNTLVPVVDNFAGISASMLVDAITFSTSLGVGDETNISLTDKNAYSLFIADKPERRNEINKQAGQPINQSVIVQESTKALIEQTTGYDFKYDFKGTPDA